MSDAMSDAMDPMEAVAGEKMEPADAMSDAMDPMEAVAGENMEPAFHLKKRHGFEGLGFWLPALPFESEARCPKPCEAPGDPSEIF